MKSPLQVGLEELYKWEARESTRVYLGHYPSHTGSVDLVLNIITGNTFKHYHVVFDNTFSTVEHMKKGTVQVN